MAKKRRQKEEAGEAQDYAFPEFDEKAYIKEEMTTAKATFLAAGIAILFAGISYAMMPYNWRLAFSVGCVGGLGATIFLIRQLGVGWEDIPKMGWVGVGGVYFFTWLMVWVVVVSPPISDTSEPLIGAPEFQQRMSGANSTVNWSTVAQPVNLLPGGGYETQVVVEVTDNFEIDGATAVITIDGGPAIPLFELPGDDVSDHHGYFGARIPQNGGSHTYKIAVQDSHGNEADYSGAFAFNG